MKKQFATYREKLFTDRTSLKYNSVKDIGGLHSRGKSLEKGGSEGWEPSAMGHWRMRGRNKAISNVKGNIIR